MNFIYYLLIKIYQIGIFIAASIGNPKAKLWINGRKAIFTEIEKKLIPGERRIWIHASSLGEFEQGRPIIETIRKEFPYYKIFLTFFSPSGFEIRKNYQGADYVFYLPIDSDRNANRLIELVKPEKVFFIKYEFWYHYLSVLKKKNIPVYLCSAIFRENQLFFKSYGSWYRKILSYFTYLFVQSEQSLQLLKTIDFHNVKVTGDTRFDRVFDIASQAKEIKNVENFVGGFPCLIIGSSWEQDENFLSRYINESKLNTKFIIAPHEIHLSHLDRLENSISKRVIRYSNWCLNQNEQYEVLIIDNIGMLSSLYKYGQVAYVGGGFGKGIHNILEASTFGLPVLFGPKYEKFQEAVELVNLGGAYPIDNFEMLKQKLDELFTDPALLQKSGETAFDYIRNRTGATRKILQVVMAN